MEHLEGQILAALRTTPGIQGPLAAAQRRPPTHRGAETWPTERVDGRRAGKAMELFQRLGLQTAAALFLGGVFHGGTSAKSSRPPMQPKGRKVYF